jgi:hypothetical protein
MTDIYSKIDRAKEIAARLVRRNTVFAKAERNRDLCLYKFFESLHSLETELRQMGGQKVRTALKTKYGGKLPTTVRAGMFAIKFTHPSLDPRTQSKYAAVLRFIRKKKKPGQSIRQFLHANGGLNGCVTKEKQLRDAKKSRKGWS